MQTSSMKTGELAANCIFAWNDPAAAWIIDPGAEPERIAAELRRLSLTPALVALTHAHFDHIGAVAGLQKEYPGIQVHISPLDAPMAFDIRNSWEPDYPPTEKFAFSADLTDGFTLECGGLRATAIHTPGHSPGSTCIYFPDGSFMATGDTLFAGSCGRTDFFGGDPAAMRASLRKLAAFPDETRVIPGHGCETAIGAEKHSNPYMLQAL